MNEVKTNEWKFSIPPPTEQDIQNYYNELNHLDP